MILYNPFVFGAPKSDLWPFWEKHNPEHSETINYSVWQFFLNQYLVTNPSSKESPESQIHRVRYADVSKTDQAQLKAALLTLQKTSITQFTRSEQLAFWINLYNASTVLLILEHYPVESITKISFGFFDFGPWEEKFLQIEGKSLSLNDIEHRILRPIWKDNRIHYALNCASLGCPNLQSQAFTAKNTELLLEKGAIEFINHPRAVQKLEGEVWLSKIYDWFQEDFGKSEKGVLQHLMKYSKTNWVEEVEENELEIEYQYNWQLNET